jgi:lysophospholipase L1-like esterase
MMAITAAALAGLWIVKRRLVKPSGEALNRLAWEANFSERGLPVPAGGPRDGYWGARMPPQTKDPDLGWREAEAHMPGLVEEDAAGLQREDSPGARAHLLIIGGSVAWGAYASTIEATYFARLARALAAQGWPVRITVLAAGAWTSEHELRALRLRGLALDPDVILILDCLNDFTQQRGSEEELAAGYVSRMRDARDLARAQGIAVVFALQPMLLHKRRSAIEDRILELSLDAPAEARLRRGYTRVRAGLRELARQEGTSFIDCADVFDGERATTFTDLWHFADPGHALLADPLARALLEVLSRQDRS